MTYRERRERRAERLREWAETRERDANAVFRDHERYRGDHAFNFQPGHIPERERVIAREERAFASSAKAREMASRADEIERQAAGAIYDDDPDAVERLQAKLADLEARRESIKTANAEYRKAHRAELKEMTAYMRDNALPFRSYQLTNLTGTIARTRQRLERLQREKVQGPRDRMITARFASSCADCGAELGKGDVIRYNRQQGARCVECPQEVK